MDRAVADAARESYPDHRIDLVPLHQTARVWFGDLLLAETNRALVVHEPRHVDRLYVPTDDVRWEHFTAAEDTHTVCPFKGQADYWDLTAVEPAETSIVWAYPDPIDEVAGLEGHVSFYQERTRIELDEPWPGDPPGERRVRGFPAWGDATDLVRLMDVQPADEGRYTAPAFGYTPRNVVEGGQLLGEAIVAACKSVPGQRVTSAFMTFAKAVAFDEPQDLTVDVLRRGRSFSHATVRVEQGGTFCSEALVLLGADAEDTIRAAEPMPDVAGPEDAVPFDFGVVGRDLRVVDAAYDRDPDRIGPPEIHVWCRFRDDPGPAHLHAALLAQSTTHWTIAAAMRPHPGFGLARTHVDLSTAVLTCAIAFHDEVDVREWLLYSNHAIWAGRGLTQGDGRVHTRDGRLVASYSCQAMIRPFDVPPGELGPSNRVL